MNTNQQQENAPDFIYEFVSTVGSLELVEFICTLAVLAVTGQNYIPTVMGKYRESIKKNMGKMSRYHATGMSAIRARRKVATDEKDFLAKTYTKFSTTPKYMAYN